MIDTTLFKQLAVKELPDSLYQQLEPHLEALCHQVEEFNYYQMQVDHFDAMDRSNRLDQIREEYAKEIAANWVAFARGRWPEIEQHFNLELEHKFYEPIEFF